MGQHKYDLPGRKLRRVPKDRCADEHRYTPEQMQALTAVDRYKRTKRRPFPTLVEILDVLKGLGWTPPPE